ncbi:hypothetical protein [Desulfococcus sp.]|uniref:hypothetical protein n=1 Tax=Desulfococcus sp. TaxID=2025834 RepID=UPI0035945E71
MNKKSPQRKQDPQANQDPITISVTKLCWAVSKVMNFVNKSKRSVVVTNRNTAIALIVPVIGQDPVPSLDITGVFERKGSK